MLPFSERGVAQILPVAPDQIECDKTLFASAKEQVTELARARIIQVNNLAIEHSRLDLQFCEKRLVQGAEGSELVPFPGDQPALALLDADKPSHLISNSQSGWERLGSTSEH